MMEFDEIVVKESPGLCRCCLSEGCYKDMGSEYTWMSENEVYADMLLECFDISISQHNDGPNGPNRLICEVCITRLRDACNFKKQVLDSEKKFVDMIGRGEFRPKVLIYQAHMKAEDVEVPLEEGDVEYLEDEIDFGDDDMQKAADTEPTVSEDITVSTLPRKSKRGRPKKTSTVVKMEKKKAKLEEKAKSSKALVKEDEPHNKEESLSDRQKKYELRRLLTAIIENSTIMPFRWSSNKYMCFYCCCPFVESSKLKQHTKEEHQDAKLNNILRSSKLSTIKFDISEISCKNCPKTVRDLEDFLTHASLAHDMKFKRELSANIFSFDLSDDGMVCRDCGQSFRFFDPLLKHVYRYHNKLNKFLCEICGQGFAAKSYVDRHVINVHSMNQRRCEKCHKTFITNYALKLHHEKVHRTNTLKCPKCPEVLGSRYLKKRHLALVHGVKNSIFNCDLCSKVFMGMSALVQHKSRIHLKEKTVTCEICGFKVFNKDLLKRHMVKHDDSRPFQCEICKKSFQRKKTLEFHRRIHTNDKRYACKDCGKAFVQVTSLKLHIRVHHSTLHEAPSYT